MGYLIDIKRTILIYINKTCILKLKEISYNNLKIWE